MPMRTRAEVLGAERLGDGAKAVMAGEPPAELQLQTSRFEVELVVDDDHEVREVVDRRATKQGGAAQHPTRS